MSAGLVPAQSALWAVIGDAALRLETAGVPSARHDAEQLAAATLGVPRSRLHSAPFFTAEQFAAFAAMVARRELREPLQHVLGTAPFRHLDLLVGPGVFTPRPETEGLVDVALAATPQGGLVVDLCAGSGAIALSVASERPDATVHAVERDEAAFGWLLRNVQTINDTVTAHLADVADALHDLDGRVDVVASNPPYLPDGLALEPEVAGFDPATALWGGLDGLDVVRVVAGTAARLLKPGGFLAVEHDDTHGAAAPALLAASGQWTDIADHRDLAGASPVRDGPAGELMRRYDCADPAARDAGLTDALRALHDHQVIVLPTDTVYGVGADAFSPAGIKALLAAKGRGRDMPVPVLVGNATALHGLVDLVPQPALDLVDAFWPGALTIVLKHAPALAWDLGETRGTVAVRMPLHPVALDLLLQSGPLGVSSANRSGVAPAMTVDEAEEQLGESVAVYLDGGVAAGQVPSTMVDLTGLRPRLLRAGAISVEALRGVLTDIEVPE